MEKFNLNSVSKFEFKEQINDQFSLFKCWVAGVGKNRNMSYIGEDVMNKALPTLNYAPVVGHLIKGEDGKYRLGSHDATIDMETWEIVPLTVPVGVVKADTYGYETVNEYGTDVKYCTAEVILWTGRYPELFDCQYSDEVFCAESMEIEVSQHRPLDSDSNYVEILDFVFSALCLLGKSDDKELNNEPCFISSRLEPINFNADEFTIKFNELKEEIQKCFSKEEGETMEDNKELMSAETEDAEVVAETEVEAEAEGTESAEAETSTESEAEVDTEAEVVSEEGTEDTDADTQEETVDYEAKYNEALAEIESLKAQVSQLEPYRLAAEQAERDKAESDVFAKYDSHIGEMEEYKTLKSKANEYSIEELDRECLILVGKFAMNTPAQTEETEVKSTITFGLDNESETKPQKYGKVYEAYKTR